MLLICLTHLSGPWSDLTSSTGSSSFSIWIPFLLLLCIFLSIIFLTFCLALKFFVLVFPCNTGASEMPRPYVTLFFFFSASTALHMCLLHGRCLINIYWVEITQIQIAGQQRSFPKHCTREKLIWEHNGKCIMRTHKMVLSFCLYFSRNCVGPLQMVSFNRLDSKDC